MASIDITLNLDYSQFRTALIYYTVQQFGYTKQRAEIVVDRYINNKLNTSRSD